MGSGLVFFLFVAGATVAIALAVSYGRRVNEAWTDAADRLGLRVQTGGLFGGRRIGGRLEGNDVVIDTYRSGGRNSRTYTRYCVRYPRPLGLGLHLTRQGFFSGIARLFGAQDIDVGQTDFDAEIIVKGADPKRIVEFLTPSRRLRVHRLLNSFSGCVIGDSEISFSSRGLELSAERIVAIVRRLHGVARHLADQRAEDRQIDRALEVQREGHLDEALTLVREASAQGTDDVLDAQVLEGEILYTGGRYQQAAEIFEQARQRVPDDPEVSAWADQAARRAPPAPGDPFGRMAVEDNTEPAPPTTSVAPAPHTEQVTAEAGLDAATVCQALFGADKMSFEITQAFEQHYQGRLVRWSGTLRKVDDYAYDLLFGSDPGGKAVFEICELSGGPFGGRSVQAVVRVPRELAEGLRPRIGETLAFHGTLVSCDTFMRNLYVADGRIDPLAT